MKDIQSTSSTSSRFEADLIRRRKEELKHVEDIKALYERKLELTNNIYMQLCAAMAQMQQRERTK